MKTYDFDIIVPAVGKRYEVVSGPFTGFIGECISYDLQSDLPVILQDENWNSKAVKISELKVIKNGKTDISNGQKQ